MTVHASRIEAATNVQALPRSASPRSRGLYSSYLKRTVDLGLVFMALPFLVPFMLILSAMIFAQDGKSPLFRQERIGRDGRRFRIWKFRTMVADAEAQLERHLEADPTARAEWNEKQKLSVDPRVTPIGRVLRRSSVDELPQLLNVLAGEMSLVGPRPMMPSQQALYSGNGYYRLRPGLTGNWQVSARNESSFADRAHFDDSYAQSVSFIGDARIVAQTVGVVLRGTGV
jgi:exopolysaccharide production protein ExoY